MARGRKRSAERVLCDLLGITMRWAKRYGGVLRLANLEPEAYRLLTGREKWTNLK